MKEKEIIEEIEFDEMLKIINNSSLKGKGNEPSCFLDWENANNPIAELGWNTPKDARWFFITHVVFALKEAKKEGIKQGRKQLADEMLKNLEDKNYSKCPDCKAENKLKCIEGHWLFKKLKNEVD